MFSYNIAIGEIAIQTNTLKRSGSFATGTILGYTLQYILKARTALTEAFDPEPLARLVSPCILFESGKK